MGRAGPAPWWRDAVIYQIYVRSFADSDGDGVGDLPGIRARLPYVRDLGVDAVWLNPFFPSPQADARLRRARLPGRRPPVRHPRRLRRPARGRPRPRAPGASSTSCRTTRPSEHPWFQEALRLRARQRRAGPLPVPRRAGPGGDEPPNDWASNFGGPAWTRVVEADGTPGQWYLHLFAPEQPDLDWTNDEVRAEFESILRFWLDRGVDGFRDRRGPRAGQGPGDARPRRPARVLGPGGRGPPALGPGRGPRGVPGLAARWPTPTPASGRSWARSGCQSPARLARYLRPDELHTAFSFGFLLAPWDAGALRHAIAENIAATARRGRRPAHLGAEQPRRRPGTSPATAAARPARRRARAAALLMLALPGAPTCTRAKSSGCPR